MATPILLLTQPAIVPTLLWSEDHETNDPSPTLGRLSNWYIGQSSPDDDSAELGGSYSRPTDGAVNTLSHSGSWAMRTSISVTATAKVGCRTNYRVIQAANPLNAYYAGAWYNMPSRVTVGGFWQHMQQKVRNTDAGTAPYVAYGLYIYNPAPGQMAYRLSYKLGADAGIPGPFEGGGLTDYHEDSEVLVPEATWYHIEMFMQPAVYPDYSGRVTIRQDGVTIFDWQNVVTLDQLADRHNTWHITNYGENLENGDSIGDGASTVVLYNDDETIGENGWIYGSSVAPWS